MSRILIALQGNSVRRSVLDAAYDYCGENRMKVDVLLVDSPEQVSPAVSEFIDRLHNTRLDCRLHTSGGPLNKAVVSHVQNHKDVYVILVDSLDSWGRGVPFRTLKQPVGLLSGIAAA